MSADQPTLLILDRTRERANRILGQNASNSAKALARDALELCTLVDEFRDELRARREHDEIRAGKRFDRLMELIR